MLRARFGGWMRGVDVFDASLFSLTSNEVELMDPQQRLLLEVSWEAVQEQRRRPALPGEGVASQRKMKRWAVSQDR